MIYRRCGSTIQTQKTKGLKARFIIVVICLILYLGLSALIGFPLGLGRMMARDIVKDYCNVIHPDSSIGKTVFNPVNSDYDIYVLHA